ncbi:hypothetical protein A3712_20455 [Vibrio sp. HI00D65]|nr:hypothetical protein A3712_20455 [Vibrio sp. HI00D65]
MHNWYEELMAGFVMMIREWWFIKLGSCGLIRALKCWKSVNKQECSYVMTKKCQIHTESGNSLGLSLSGDI